MAKKKETEHKTNVMRLLDQAGIPYTPHFYKHEGEQEVGVGVHIAKALGQNVEQAFKTLVTRGSSGGFFVFVIPVAEELDLKKAARAVGEKNVEMIAVKEILAVTGYVRGGCSPLGMKKPYPTVIDESCLLFDTIYLSAGKIGAQVEVPPDKLCALLGAKTIDLIQERRQ
ncbi:MAG TPA: Cys-tRNA(Pro) deacylase [Firmicutes bacterium]|nr:Cys-tRNA(Pro) deacylase [Bacillota bacterium]